MTATEGGLPTETHDKIVQMSEQGHVLAEQGKWQEAADTFRGALALLPEPRSQWEAATWLLGSIGDVSFQMKAYEQAAQVLTEALSCPAAIGNSFIHLRLGQCQLELGDTERAAEELARAYAIEGKGIFAAEDPKYLAFLKL